MIVHSPWLPRTYNAVFLCAFWPWTWIIIIRSDRRGDPGLLAHEKKHLEQYRAAPWTFAWRMLFDKTYRYHREREAYAEQLLHDSINVKYQRSREYAAVLEAYHGGTFDSNLRFLLDYTKGAT